MRRAVVCMATFVAVLAPASLGRAASDDVGSVTTLRSYDADAGELPEGLAVDKRGAIYLTMPFIGELRRVAPDGSETVVAQLPIGNGPGALGLAVSAPGDLYAGVATSDPATQGVYRVTPDGVVSRVPGSEAIDFANGLAFGDRGTLYVTDSIAGEVWRIPRDGPAELWVADPLLEGDGSAPLPFPVGANGIAYHHRTVYVTNTELGSIVAIPVLPDGTADEPRLVVQDAALGGADGVAIDVHGNLYVAVIAQSTIVRVTPDGSTIDVLADSADHLDYPSSVAFGSGRGARTTLYAVNFSAGPIFGDVRTWGPRLLAVEAGVPGLPQP